MRNGGGGETRCRQCVGFFGPGVNEREGRKVVLWDIWVNEVSLFSHIRGFLLIDIWIRDLVEMGLIIYLSICLSRRRKQ